MYNTFVTKRSKGVYFRPTGCGFHVLVGSNPVEGMMFGVTYLASILSRRPHPYWQTTRFAFISENVNYRQKAISPESYLGRRMAKENLIAKSPPPKRVTNLF